jgi:hypothetical protein
VNLANPATKAELDAWVQSEGAPNTWVHEANAATLADGIEGFYNVGRETYFIIDLSTMKVTAVYSDNVNGALADLNSHLP